VNPEKDAAIAKIRAYLSSKSVAHDAIEGLLKLLDEAPKALKDEAPEPLKDEAPEPLKDEAPEA
jgi:hypothetical protein